MLDPIPGDPAKLAAAARVFAAGGAAIESLSGRAGRVSDVELAGWKGPAARSFRTDWSATQGGLQHAAAACQEIATTLHRLSTQVTESQDSLSRARSMLAAGAEADALRLGAQAQELARQAFTAASREFGRIEVAAGRLRLGMAASRSAPSIVETPVEPELAWKEVIPVVSFGPSIQVTVVPGDAPWRELFPIGPPTNQPLTSSARDPRDILMPGGKPIGGVGSDPGIRELEGGVTEAEDLFKKLTRGGVPHTPTTYPGLGVTLLEGGWVGFRISGKSGPVIDINVPKLPELKKLHFR